MASPTQEDLDYLRENSGDPNVVRAFEQQFKMPAVEALRDGDRPTENDLQYLRENGQDEAVVSAFRNKFGDHELGIAMPERQQSRWQKTREAQRGMSTLEKMGPGPIMDRVTAGAGDIAEELFSPTNWATAASKTADVLSEIPSAIQNPGEFARGVAQGALTLPGGINDLALGAVDKGAQIIAGADPLPDEAYANNPVGSEATRGMLTDWGNKASRAVTGGDAFDFEAPADPGAALARRVGEFTGAGGILGGTKAIVPSITSAMGAEVSNRVAPDDPNWQLLGGGIGALAPAGVSGGISAAAGLPSRLAPVKQLLTDQGRQEIAGGVLRRAAGLKPGDAPPPLEANPLQTMQPTLGQQTNNPGLLQLEKTIAMGSPDNTGVFKERLHESHAAAREAAQALRGGGSIEEIRAAADRAVASADDLASSAEMSASSGRTPGQASEAARNLLDQSRSTYRAVERGLWGAPALRSPDALVPVDPIRQAMAEFMSSRPKFADKHFPPDIEQALRLLNEREPLTELQALRSDLGAKARAATAAGKASEADIYNGLQNAVANNLDGLEFANPDTQAAYQTARNFTRLRAQLFRNPNEMRSTMARNVAGGDVVNPAATLDKFVKPGAAGRDTIRQVLNIDSSAEMANAIGDYLADKMQTGRSASAARDFLRKYQDTLSEPALAEVRDRLTRVAEARAFREAVREGPLSMFAGAEPGVAIKRIMGHEDRVNLVRRLKHSLSRNNPRAWDGLRAVFVDELMSRVSSLIERANGGAAMKPGEFARFARDHADLAQEILGPTGANTLRNIADGIEMATRTQRGGYPGGSPTYSLLSGDKFIDNVILKYLDAKAHPMAAPGAGAAAGGSVGGTPGAIIGAGGGFLAQRLFGNVKAQIEDILREAMLDPAKGRALMMQATQSSLRAIPRQSRPILERFVSAAKKAAAPAAAAGTTSPAAQKRPLRVGQTVTGMMDGKPVTFRYLGGNPKLPESWERSPQ